MKPITHKKITSLAIERIQTELSFTEFQIQELIKGVQQEDNPTISRLLNWHFYPANSKLSKRRWFLHPNSLAITEKREADLKKSLRLGKKDMFRIMGRILHHLQDMNTPSHVIPIYHSVGSKADPFENYLVNCWADIEPLLHIGDEEVSSAGKFEFDHFSQMYLHCGLRLIESLKDKKGLFPLKNKKTGLAISADMFWNKDAEAGLQFKAPLGINGFGSFGEYGKNFNSRSLDELFSRKKVAAFFMNSAIKDTIIALNHFRKKLQGE